MLDTAKLAALFTLLWVITFLPAWFLLGKLVALSFSLRSSLVSVKFWGILILYLFVIALPYLAVLSQLNTASKLLQAIVTAILILSLLIVLVRVFLARRVEAALWWVYGFVYDGLRSFYPYQLLVSRAVERLDPKHDEIVLDLGCGTGNASELIAERKPKHLYMADNSSSMLRQARRKLKRFENVAISRQDAVDYLRTLESGKVDKVLLINVVYAVHNREELWAELLRVLTDDGKITSTSSDKEGNFVLIKEHLAHAQWYRLLYPKLIAVFVIDSLISSLASAGTFHFLSQEEITSEIQRSGGKVQDIERCYGGPEEGVNLMMTISKA
jgi:ubiquinone/menaquinone biosynthesis C-methylase UbiE